MHSFALRTGLVLLSFIWSCTCVGAPQTINIQGSLADTNGDPVAGTRAYRVQFYDAPTGGATLGAPIEGFVTVSVAGRFSIDLIPPEQALDANEVYYQLGIDSGNPTDGSVDPVDLFPGRVKVNSVLFARRANHAATADTAGLANHATTATQSVSATTAEHASTADVATNAIGLSGPLNSPGDQIPLGNDVFLQVAADGIVEILADGVRQRLARQKWFDPRNVTENLSPDGQDAVDAQVALNANDEAIIVWGQSDGLNNQILRSEFRGGSWSDPSRPIDNFTPDGSDAFRGKVALNDNGDAVIVWRQSDGANFQIFRSENRDGSWSDPTGLTDNISPDGQETFIPQVAMNNNGDAVIVWPQSNGANQQVFRSEYRNGVWSDPTGLADNISPDGQNAILPKVAISDNGDAVIVWHQSNGSNHQIFRSERRNGVWSDPTGLADNISPDGQEATDARVAMNGNGDALVVWTQSDGANDQIFRSEYRNGVWNDPSGLSDNISPNGQDALTPSAAINDNGDALIVWSQFDGANIQIYRSERRNGSWTDPSNLADNISPDGQLASDPQVALNSKGDAVIVWRQRDGAMLRQIFRSEFRNGVWRDPASLSDNISPDGQLAENPQVALNENGNAIIVWNQSDGLKEQIFRSEFKFGF